MADFYVKKNKVSYELSNGKKLIDEYDNEKEKDLKAILDKMEDTISFEKNFKPYDFSFMKSDNEEDNDIEREIKEYFKKVKKTESFTVGINTEGPYKDKWFRLDEKNKKGIIIDELKSKPFCARVDYVKEKNKVFLQYMLSKKGKIIKSEFDIESNVDDDILKEYLK